ncbi:MAG: hypothetical protein H0T84_00240 [Tatlockia sp.]|nr:hypothetical protein [Tatlockia sp.]
MANHVDNVYSFYKKAGESLTQFSISPSKYLGLQAFQFVFSRSNDLGTGFVLGIVACGFGILFSLPFTAATFCLALIAAVPLALAALFVFGGAAILDYAESESEKEEYSSPVL